MALPASPCDQYTANQLVDVIILACGFSDPMLPLASTETVKAMLPICNRPLIWYCLAPLVEAGFSTFYICVDDDYVMIENYLRRVFSDAFHFFFVEMPSGKNSHLRDLAMEEEGIRGAITTASAVKAFLQFKRNLQMHPESSENFSHPLISRQASEVSMPTLNATSPPLGESVLGSQAGPLPNQQRSRNPSGRFSSGAEHGVRLEPRDALIIRSDTILSHIDIETFVKNFAISLSSVTMMLMKPIDSPTSQWSKEPAAAPAKAGGKGGSGPKTNQGQTLRAFQYEYSCAVYEDEEDRHFQLNQCRAGSAAMSNDAVALSPGEGLSIGSFPVGHHHSRSGGSSTRPGSPASFYASVPDMPFISLQTPVTNLNSSPTAAMPSPYPPHFHRIHYIQSAVDEPELSVTLSYAAKRPSLRFEKGIVDPKVYLVRHWVLEYLAKSAADREGDDEWEGGDQGSIPFLARKQHSMINLKKKFFVSPDKIIGYSIPPHWFFEGRGNNRIETLNSAYCGLLPPRGDPLKVSAVIFEEHPQSLRRIYRIHTPHNLLAANEEVVAARAAAVKYNMNNASGGFEAKGAQRRALSPGELPAMADRGCSPVRATDTGNSFYSSSLYSQQLVARASLPISLRQQSLSLLLPDLSVTFQQKKGEIGMYVIDSFVQSPVPINTYITRSVIGPGVKLQSGARITNSIVMQGSEVSEGSVVNGTVVGNGSVIHSGVKVVNCVVQPMVDVKSNAEGITV